MSAIQVDPAELLRSPDFFLHSIDVEGDAAWFVRMSPEHYRASSFLDERVKKTEAQPLRLSLAGLVQVCSEAAEPTSTAHYLFHVGHCGSTLLAQVLDDLPDLFVLREPMALRILTELLDETTVPDGRVDQRRWNALFETVRHMLSRSYDRQDTALIKATSICGNLIEPCLAADPGSRALLMGVTLETYLAGMLRPERRPELGANSRLRIRQLQARARRRDLRLYEMSDAQKAAMNWMTAMVFFRDALEDPQRRNQVRLVCFDTFLADRQQALRDIAVFLGCSLDEARLAALSASKHFATYAKNPERAFDASMRAEQLLETRRTVGDEIAVGLAWARELCDKSKGLAGLTGWLEGTELRG